MEGMNNKPELPEVSFNGVELYEAMKPAIANVAKAIRLFNDRAVEVFAKLSKNIRKTMNKIIDNMLYHANDNPKWWHLYKHSKKFRIRKKYRRRLMQQLLRKLEAAAATRR